MKRRVIVELKSSERLTAVYQSAEANRFTTMDTKILPKLNGCNFDTDFPALALPSMTPRSPDDQDNSGDIFDLTNDVDYNMAMSESTFLVRGEVDDDKLDAFISASDKNKQVVQVYADPEIESFITCNPRIPVGTSRDVEGLLNVVQMRSCRMTGKGVRVAIVDTGVNMAHLQSRGKNPGFDASNSWKPSTSNITPGSAPVGHGTMCAYDATIAAPDCTILDIALLTSRRPGGFGGFLSDAILAFRHLLNVINNTPAGQNKSLVVNNSWGMFHPSWDAPVSSPMNYSDNPNHPFNRIVRTLERAGADILFAAGNCGTDCPDNRCQGVTNRTIYGANSSPYVLTVAGADIQKNRVGYSSKGPGRLSKKKPDITGYTHFYGSEALRDNSGRILPDLGTSAACPVVAGVVAAIRSKRPYTPGNGITSPAAIRNLITSTAEDRGGAGYDYAYGYGLVSGTNIMKKLKCLPTINCRKYPWLCWPKECWRFPWLCDRRYFCRKFPNLCWRGRIPRIPDFPRPPIPRIPGSADLEGFYAAPDNYGAFDDSYDYGQGASENDYGVSYHPNYDQDYPYSMDLAQEHGERNEQSTHEELYQTIDYILTYLQHLDNPDSSTRKKDKDCGCHK